MHHVIYIFLLWGAFQPNGHKVCRPPSQIVTWQDAAHLDGASAFQEINKKIFLHSRQQRNAALCQGVPADWGGFPRRVPLEIVKAPQTGGRSADRWVSVSAVLVNGSEAGAKLGTGNAHQRTSWKDLKRRAKACFPRLAASLGGYVVLSQQHVKKPQNKWCWFSDLSAAIMTKK